MHTPGSRIRQLMLLLALAASLTAVSCTGAANRTPARSQTASTPVRFLLTLDDGPSVKQTHNPTLSILDQLDQNDVQRGIKAVFFVQTRNVNGGGTQRGREILQATHDAGHILAVHSGSPLGHLAHSWLTNKRLARSLHNAMTDIASIAGEQPIFVRPPFWTSSKRTRQVYREQHLHMLLSDVKTNDGVIRVFKVSFRRRSHLRGELDRTRLAIERGELPVIDGVVPVVVTFHDVNTFTAGHLTEYLHILIEEAARVGLTTATTPFYDQSQEIERVALRRSRT